MHIYLLLIIITNLKSMNKKMKEKIQIFKINKIIIFCWHVKVNNHRQLLE
jgi:hypothetical protein